MVPFLKNLLEVFELVLGFVNLFSPVAIFPDFSVKDGGPYSLLVLTNIGYKALNVLFSSSILGNNIFMEA